MSRRTKFLRNSYVPTEGCTVHRQIVDTMSAVTPNQVRYVLSLMYYRISMEGRARRSRYVAGPKHDWSGFPYHHAEISKVDFLKCVAKADSWFASLKTATLDRWIKESDAMYAAEQADFPE